jgi:hypothetical protein
MNVPYASSLQWVDEARTGTFPFVSDEVAAEASFGALLGFGLLSQVEV